MKAKLATSNFQLAIILEQAIDRIDSNQYVRECLYELKRSPKDFIDPELINFLTQVPVVSDCRKLYGYDIVLEDGWQFQEIHTAMLEDALRYNKGTPLITIDEFCSLVVKYTESEFQDQPLRPMNLFLIEEIRPNRGGYVSILVERDEKDGTLNIMLNRFPSKGVSNMKVRIFSPNLMLPVFTY